MWLPGRNWLPGKEIYVILINVARIHRKLMITESQFYFANISTTKSQIFMKFYEVVNYYLVSLSFKFYEDPCINARAIVVNARTRD